VFLEMLQAVLVMSRKQKEMLYTLKNIIFFAPAMNTSRISVF
jgi:hypothetical protein